MNHKEILDAFRSGELTICIKEYYMHSSQETFFEASTALFALLKAGFSTAASCL